jgi:branched-chain amino acid transport system permease protein
MEGPYLALSTFSLAVATPQILKLHALESWTGGVQGLLVAQVSAPAGLPLTPDQWLYFLCLLIVALMFLVAWNLVRGRIGLAMVAIRDHPLAAAGMGINTAMVKSMTFAFSALYTGIAGALGALAAQFASPESFSIFLSISLLVGIVVGGIGTISGALFGALFIQFVPNLAEQVSKAAPWMVYGVFLLVCMYLMPGGAAELMRRLAARLARSGRTDRSQTDDRMLMMIAGKGPSPNQGAVQTVTRKPCRFE